MFGYVVVNQKSLKEEELAAYREFESRVNLVDDKLSAIEMVRNAISEKIAAHRMTVTHIIVMIRLTLVNLTDFSC